MFDVRPTSDLLSVPNPSGTNTPDDEYSRV